MRHTRSHTANRRSHHKVKNQAVTEDKETGVVRLRHRASLETGEYKGRKVLNTMKSAEKKLKKKTK